MEVKRKSAFPKRTPFRFLSPPAGEKPAERKEKYL